jgi:hypothetical protein
LRTATVAVPEYSKTQNASDCEIKLRPARFFCFFAGTQLLFRRSIPSQKLNLPPVKHHPIGGLDGLGISANLATHQVQECM